MFIAIAQRDREFIVSKGTQILEIDDLSTPEQKRYIASAVLMAMVVGNDFNAATEFWKKHQSSILMGTTNLETSMIMLLATVQALAENSAGIELALD